MKAYHWRNIIAERERLARLAKGKPAPDAPDVKVTLPPNNALVAQRTEQGASIPTVGGSNPPERAMPRITMLAATTPGRYICMECAHYEYRSCTNPRARHPLSGEYVDAYGARKNRDSCGPTGRYWSARPARARPPRVVDDSEPMEYVPPVPVRVVAPFKDEVVIVLWERGAATPTGDVTNAISTAARAGDEPPALARDQIAGVATPPPAIYGKKYRTAPPFTAMQLAIAAVLTE